MPADDVAKNAIRIGISACLLGHSVRYDGGHKRYDWITEKLALHVQFVPVCPEVEFGMGVPRPPIELVRVPDDDDGQGVADRAVRLFATDTGADLTDAMRGFAVGRVEALADECLSGYVFKTRSPSCGLTQVAVFARLNDPEPVARDGRGLFAEALIARFPGLPITEEHVLDSREARDGFIAAVRRYHGLHHASRP